MTALRRKGIRPEGFRWCKRYVNLHIGNCQQNQDATDNMLGEFGG